MKDLKFLLVTNNLNKLSLSFCNKLNDIGLVRTLQSKENNKIINAIIHSKIDVIFLDVAFLGKNETARIHHLIENITGKTCFQIESYVAVEEKITNNYTTIGTFNQIDFTILKIDLLSLIIESLNRFNNNKLLRKEKCYDFIYIVWEDLSIKKVEIKSIIEISKNEKATYLFCIDKKVENRIINISFEMLYKLLNKNFEKSRFKITNKDWLKNNTQKSDFFLRNSA